MSRFRGPGRRRRCIDPKGIFLLTSARKWTVVHHINNIMSRRTCLQSGLLQFLYITLYVDNMILSAQWLRLQRRVSCSIKLLQRPRGTVGGNIVVDCVPYGLYDMYDKCLRLWLFCTKRSVVVYLHSSRARVFHQIGTIVKYF